MRERGEHPGKGRLIDYLCCKGFKGAHQANDGERMWKGEGCEGKDGGEEDEKGTMNDVGAVFSNLGVFAPRFRHLLRILRSKSGLRPDGPCLLWCSLVHRFLFGGKLLRFAGWVVGFFGGFSPSFSRTIQLFQPPLSLLPPPFCCMSLFMQINNSFSFLSFC